MTEQSKAKITSALIFGTVLLYFWWVQGPRDVSEYVERLAGEVETRFSQRQQHAAEEASNGFIDPVWRVFWGRIGFEYEPNSQVESVVKSVSDRYSSVACGRLLEHWPEQGSPDNVRREFESLLGHLKSALSKPSFVVPETEPSLDAPGAHLPNLLTLSLALSGYCEQLRAEGKTEESLECLKLIFQVGDKLVNQESNGPTLAGVQIHSIGLQTINGLLGPDSRLSAQQWKDLADVLQSQRPPESGSLAYRCTANHSYAVLKTLDSAECRKRVPVMVRYWPGLYAREKRITRRVLRDLGSLVETGKYNYWALNFNWPQYLMGEVGYLSSSLTQDDVFRVPRELDSIDARLLGYALSSGLMAYRAEHGDYPETLNQLKSYGVDPTGYLYSAEYKLVDGAAELKLSVWSLDGSQMLEQGPFFTDTEGWARAKGQELLFALPR